MTDTVLQAGVTKNAISPPGLAKNLFKKSVNVGEAVVSILGSTGIAGFKFHVPQSEQVTMESEITDNYIDTNSAVQDHILRKPITITVRGYQGEYFYSANPIENTLALITPTLSLVKEFLPKLRTSTQQIKKTSAKDVLNKKFLKQSDTELNSIDLFSLFQDLYKITSAQTRTFMFFEALWKSNALFTVETGWKRYDNMAILKIVPLRDNNADITDFSITFKQISKTTSKVEQLKKAAGRLKQQKAEVTQKGIDKGKEVDTVKPGPQKTSFGVTRSW